MDADKPSVVNGSTVSKTEYSVDEIHDIVDQFMLNIFETVREAKEHDQTEGLDAIDTATRDAQSGLDHQSLNVAKVIDSYREAMAAVDNIVGMEHTLEEQHAIIEQQNKEIGDSMEMIKNLEAEMERRRTQFRDQLHAELTDERLGLKNEGSLNVDLEK